MLEDHSLCWLQVQNKKICLEAAFNRNQPKTKHREPWTSENIININWRPIRLFPSLVKFGGQCHQGQQQKKLFKRKYAYRILRVLWRITKTAPETNGSPNRYDSCVVGILNYNFVPCRYDIEGNANYRPEKPLERSRLRILTSRQAGTIRKSAPVVTSIVNGA